MDNFYLLNSALVFSELGLFISYIENLLVLCTEEKTSNDTFLYHSSLWGHETEIGVMTDLLFTLAPDEYKQSIIPKILSSFITSETECFAVVDLAENFPDSDSAFLGSDFSSSTIDPHYQIVNQHDFQRFKQSCVPALSCATFWSLKDKMFSHIVLCEDVEQQVLKLGNSKYIGQIAEKLSILNEFAPTWTYGNFDYFAVSSRYALNISPESEATLIKYGNYRTFSLPDDRIELFDLHIKTGDLRFHFFPDNETHTLYVGYIGMHLPIVSSK